MCVNEDTREVVQVDSADQLHFVNSSIELFATTTRAVLEEFPLYSEDAPFSEFDAAAHRIRAIIAQLDPAAMRDDDSFWLTFVNDVAHGDFSSEDVQKEVPWPI
jgi:hypothetical protein